MADENLEERLQKLETHVVHLERLYDELNQVVVEQAKQLQRIQAQQHRLASSIEESELERIRNTNSKPPHYQP